MNGWEPRQPEGPRQPPDPEAQSTLGRTEPAYPSACTTSGTDRWPRELRTHGAHQGDTSTEHDKGQRLVGRFQKPQPDSGTRAETAGRQTGSQAGQKEGRGETAFRTRVHMGRAAGTLSGYEVV